MIRLSVLLGVALVLPYVSSAEEAKLNSIRLKQGCVFNCPEFLEILDRRSVAEIESLVEGVARSSVPSFKAKVESASIAFVAADDQQNPQAQLTLLILPAEVSQAELKAFDENRKEWLREVMHQQTAGLFAKAGIKVQKKWPAEVKEGSSLSYFLWGYEFVDRSQTPQISLRAYYYTQKATFILGMSCHKTFFDEHKATLMSCLASFDTSL